MYSRRKWYKGFYIFRLQVRAIILFKAALPKLWVTTCRWVVVQLPVGCWSAMTRKSLPGCTMRPIMQVTGPRSLRFMHHIVLLLPDCGGARTYH